MVKFVVPDDASSESSTTPPPTYPPGPPGPSPQAPGAWIASPPKPPTKPATKPGPSSPLDPRHSRGERILKAVTKPRPSRWLSFQKIRDRHVVVKRVPQRSLANSKAIESVRRTLNYPGLVRMIEHSGFGPSGAILPTAPRTTTWEYCDLGTLGDLIYEQQEGVDEGLIWHVLLSLLKTALYIHTGEKYYPHAEQKGPAPDWQPLVHIAIDPDNIFLMESKGFHPYVKLGNFSQAVKLQSVGCKTDHYTFPHRTLYKAATAATDMESMSTLTGFEAPEFLYTGVEDGEWDWEQPNNMIPTGCRSDLWSIAAVAIAMMGGIERTVEPYFGKGTHKIASRWQRLLMKSVGRETTGWHRDDMPQKYSVYLREFLSPLLWPDPIYRPDTREAFLNCMTWHKAWEDHFDTGLTLAMQGA